MLETNHMKIYILLPLVLFISCQSLLKKNSEEVIKVTKFIGKDYTVYESDSTRFFFSYYFHIGMNVDWNDTEGAKQYYLSSLKKIGSLFESGQLTPTDFYLAFQNNKIQKTEIDNELSIHFLTDTTSFNDSLHIELFNDKFRIIKFLFKETNTKDDITIHTIYSTFSPYEDGWGAMMMFNLYLKNDTLIRIDYDGMQI